VTAAKGGAEAAQGRAGGKTTNFINTVTVLSRFNIH